MADFVPCDRQLQRTYLSEGSRSSAVERRLAFVAREEQKYGSKNVLIPTELNAIHERDR